MTFRAPPKNPFKPEPENEPEDVAMPEIPKRVYLTGPVEPIPHKTEATGNGHDKEADKQVMEDELTADEKAEAERQKKEDAELEKMREEADDAKIPGSGSLFNVKKKHLPEFTRLNEREVFTFGVGDVQDAVLDLKRTDSVFEIFKNSIFRLKISLKGEGRSENVAVRQVDAEEKANAARGSMNGI